MAVQLRARTSYVVPSSWPTPPDGWRPQRAWKRSLTPYLPDDFSTAKQTKLSKRQIARRLWTWLFGLFGIFIIAIVVLVVLFGHGSVTVEPGHAEITSVSVD